MFWLGLLTGIIIYAIIALGAFIYGKIKLKKKGVNK